MRISVGALVFDGVDRPGAISGFDRFHDTVEPADADGHREPDTGGSPTP